MLPEIASVFSFILLLSPFNLDSLPVPAPLFLLAGFSYVANVTIPDSVLIFFFLFSHMLQCYQPLPVFSFRGRAREPNDRPLKEKSISNFTLKIKTPTDHFGTLYHLKAAKSSVSVISGNNVDSGLIICDLWHKLIAAFCWFVSPVFFVSFFSSKGEPVTKEDIFVAVKTCRKFHSERGESVPFLQTHFYPLSL